MTTSEEVFVLDDLKMSELIVFARVVALAKERKKGGGDNTKSKDGEKED